MSYYTTGNVTYNPYTINIGTGGSGGAGSILTGGSSTSPIWQSTGTYTIANGSNGGGWNSNGVKITTKGVDLPEDSDINFGNVSLRKTLESIESRLAILRPDHELEENWEELKALGDAYRKLEKEIQEKLKTWEVLKRVDE